MWGLEYLMLFGVPKNKVELLDGKSRWAFPFLDREGAEAHLHDWLETLVRWKGALARPTIQKNPKSWTAIVNGVTVELCPRPIDVRFPIDWQVFRAFYDTFWQPEMWPGEQERRARGWMAGLDHQDVSMNVWSLFGEFCGRHGGCHSGRTDIALSDTAAVSPDQYYYRKGRKDIMIEGDYFCGPPDLVAEVLSPASLTIDRGPRQEVYRRAGVPHLWLLDPEPETVEVYELVAGAFQQTGTHHSGQSFETAVFPGEWIDVAGLFETQTKRHGDEKPRSRQEPIAEWLIAPDKQVGLEYFFLLGHPEHRCEIWGNKAPSVLAFGSSTEAKARLPHFIKEACAWEGLPLATATEIADDVDQAEVGRFKFTQSGRHVHLDVAVDGRKFRELLVVHSKREAWDWGEK